MKFLFHPSTLSNFIGRSVDRRILTFLHLPLQKKRLQLDCPYKRHTYLTGYQRKILDTGYPFVSRRHNMWRV